MESILTSIKKLLGLTEDYAFFDNDIILHINSTFNILKQLGVGPAEGFRITGTTETWDDFLRERADLEMVKTYVYQKVRLLFDPPTSTPLMEAINRSVSEFEWRLNAAAETENSD